MLQGKKALKCVRRLSNNEKAGDWKECKIDWSGGKKGGEGNPRKAPLWSISRSVQTTSACCPHFCLLLLLLKASGIMNNATTINSFC